MNTILRHIIKCTMALSAMLMVTSCDVIYDEEGDCSVNYRVRFIDNMNLKFADAFDDEMASVTLFAFDENGTLVWKKTESGSQLKTENGEKYAMDINDLGAGSYHLVVWGGLDNSKSFSAPSLEVGRAKLEDLTCSLNRSKVKQNGYDIVSEDLEALFHGMSDITIPETNEPGTYNYDIQLTKDTNNVTVVLQQLNGESLDPDIYDFEIEADNGHLNHDNGLLNDEEPFKYKAWNLDAGEASIERVKKMNGSLSRVSSETSAVVADLTIARIVLNDWTLYTRPRLTVNNKETGETVLSIPLIDYALLVRGNYSNVTSDQEYLDRQDKYNMTFFLNDGKWMSSEIIINSWRIVLNDDELN